MSRGQFPHLTNTEPEIMKKRFQIITLLVFVSITGHSAVPAPEKLLPDETLGVLTVPDYAKASAAYNANASSQVWRDPALKPFREKLVNKFNEEVIKPLERELGVKLNDYCDLARGQITFAVLQNGWRGKDEPLPAWLLLVDTRDKSPQLKTNLADLRKKWVDSGKTLKTEKIREVEFLTLTVSGADVAKTLEKSFADPGADKDKSDEKKSESNFTITVGQ